MPKIVRRPRRDPVIEARLAEWKEFESPTGWKRSKKGNRWRHWEGATLTIFKRRDECFGWCIADGEENQFSSSGFETEADAISDLGDAVGIGM